MTTTRRRQAEQAAADMAVTGPGGLDTAPLTRRLHRIEGQVRGIARMIDEDRDCIDILTQISAVTKALQSAAIELLDEHLRSSVAAITGDADLATGQSITEATRAIERLLRM